MTIYDKIQALCTQNGVSVNKLEQDVGLSVASISKWKTASPTVRNLKKVADYFGVTVDYLMSNEKE